MIRIKIKGDIFSEGKLNYENYMWGDIQILCTIFQINLIFCNIEWTLYLFLFQISTDTNIQAVKRNCFLVLVIAYIICSHVPESFRWFVGLSQLLVVCILHKEIYKERGIVTARKKFCHDTNQHFILSLSLSLSLSLCLFLWKFEYVLAYMHMYIHYLIHSWLNLVSSIYTGWEVTGTRALEFRI